MPGSIIYWLTDQGKSQKKRKIFAADQKLTGSKQNKKINKQSKTQNIKNYFYLFVTPKHLFQQKEEEERVLIIYATILFYFINVVLSISL
jgi:hypothetical protein